MKGPSGAKIITFYSYKGGTGRSMALANVAWLLAAAGKRVLAIDWDLEAPGLHRYFHPFLEDKELTSTPGLVDFVTEFVEAARRQAPADAPSGEPWYEPYTDITRYALSLDWRFPGEGTVDLVPAGQQGPGYAVRVTALNWQELYERLGGGVWLERVKQRMRAEYDYVLIDSRTGISDTSGICTIQMPDELVVCFTMNQQSVKGAAAAAESAWTQRRKPSGEPALKIWPVPMRVELGEKDRLGKAREFARQTFELYTLHMRGQRNDYWDDIEVVYEPYYAYEQVLAPFAERHRGKATLLRSMETLATYLAGERVVASTMPEERRRQKLAEFTRLDEKKSGEGAVYIAYLGVGHLFQKRLSESLQWHFPKARFWSAYGDILPGENLAAEIQRGIAIARVALVVFGPAWRIGDVSEPILGEFVALERRGIPVIPVIAPGGVMPGPKELPPHIAWFGRQQAVGASEAEPVHDQLLMALERIIGAAEESAHPDDPQKGRWGGTPSRLGRILRANVSEISTDWFDVQVAVEATTGAPLEGTVDFHLHPTFPKTVETVPVKDGRAVLRFGAYGAFTIGAVADEGRTKLELDLAQLPDAPRRFVER